MSMVQSDTYLGSIDEAKTKGILTTPCHATKVTKPSTD